MRHVPAPRSSRGDLRPWLAILLVGLVPPSARAQAPKAAAQPKAAPKAAATPKAAAKAEDAPPPLTPEQQEEAGVVDTETVKRTARVETFQDPRAEALLDPAGFKEVPAPRPSPLLEREINAAAVGQGRVDNTQIRAYVQTQAARLTKHENIKALVAPDPDLNPNSAVAKDFNAAGEALMKPLQDAMAARNTGFLTAYRRELLAVLPSLLNNHLMVRIQAMIVLGTAGDPEAMAEFIKQIQDPEQVLMVKLWAARGLTNIAQGGQREVEVGRGAAAARAISELLTQQPDLPWPVRMRMLEALGALRMAGQNGAENAAAALQILADPNARPTNRSWASWALGLMKVPPQVSQYNYGLVAYHMGQAAVEIGTTIDAEFEEGLDIPRRLAGLLVYQLLPGFLGDPDVRESGITRSPALGRSGKMVNEIASQVQAIAVAALNLTGPATPRPELPQRRKELAARVAALRDYLAKNPPEDTHLVPGGPEFPAPQAPQVATGARP